MWRIYPSEIFFKPEPQKNAEKGEWERGRRSEEETRRERGELRIFVVPPSPEGCPLAPKLVWKYMPQNMTGNLAISKIKQQQRLANINSNFNIFRRSPRLFLYPRIIPPNIPIIKIQN